jgi:type VI secretion system secreted protein Hcp
MPAFVKLGDIKGQATDAGHKDWIIIESMSAPIHRSIPANARDQQRTQGSTALGDVVLVRELDKSSTKIQEACANGTFFPDVQIDLCATVGNNQEPYLQYKLKNVIITSYSFHGNASGSPLPSEELTLGYTEIEWNYIVLNPDTGKKEGNVPGKYNPAQGKS